MTYTLKDLSLALLLDSIKEEGEITFTGADKWIDLSDAMELEKAGLVTVTLSKGIERRRSTGIVWGARVA